MNDILRIARLRIPLLRAFLRRAILRVIKKMTNLRYGHWSRDRPSGSQGEWVSWYH